MSNLTPLLLAGLQLILLAAGGFGTYKATQGDAVNPAWFSLAIPIVALVLLVAPYKLYTEQRNKVISLTQERFLVSLEKTYTNSLQETWIRLKVRNLSRTPIHRCYAQLRDYQFPPTRFNPPIGQPFVWGFPDAGVEIEATISGDEFLNVFAAIREPNPLNPFRHRFRVYLISRTGIRWVWFSQQRRLIYPQEQSGHYSVTIEIGSRENLGLSITVQLSFDLDNQAVTNLHLVTLDQS